MAFLPHGFEEPGDVEDIRLVVDTMPTLAWSAGPDGSADFFNQRWLDYRGLSAKQALGWGSGGIGGIGRSPVLSKLKCPVF
jgi:hypothetical protein